ncbi:MAG: hypothetical protein IT290_07180 [Deltaproteobacteria bacterium]|nr:hypothetical protein [Deltaproteobacteria bacterium]
MAPKQVVILPVTPKPDTEESVFAYAEKVAAELRKLTYSGYPLVVTVDKRDIRGGEKNWQWIKKGIPVRIEVGPRDVTGDNVMLARRDKEPTEKEKISRGDLPARVLEVLDEIQANYFAEAKRNLDANIRTDITSFEDFRAYFTAKNPNKPEVHGGFVRAKWCGDPKSLDVVEDLKITIRCLPLDQSNTTGTCILSGKPATIDAIFAKAY